MMKFYKILFLNTMILGTLIAISSYSWLSMWMGLEINLLSVIPLLTNSKNIYSSEGALKYFITQALASAVFLFSVIISLNSSDLLMDSPVIPMITNSALLTKMGAAPFHFWFPEVIEGLNWFMSLIMLTWQKIAPMVLLMYNLNMPGFILMVIITSTVIGGVMGLNQTSLRKILAFSSINHIGWMLASMMHSLTIWTIYFVIYTIISINIVLILEHLNIFYLKQLFNSINFNKLIKFFFILNFLSLGGLPPFMGFFPKWLTVNNLIQSEMYFLSLILIVFTLITLFFYLRITFSTFVINTNESIIFKPSMISSMILAFNFVTLSGLLICVIMFNYL